MKTPDDFLDKLSEQVNDLFDHGKQTTHDIRVNVRSLIQSQLAKLDVVTREEFDTQQSVLEKTRAQIDQLEKQISILEEKLDSIK